MLVGCELCLNFGGDFVVNGFIYFLMNVKLVCYDMFNEIDRKFVLSFYWFVMVSVYVSSFVL